MNSSSQQKQASLHSHGGLIKDNSRKVFIKFPLKKETSIELHNNLDEKSEMYSQHDYHKITSNNSQKSLSSAKTPRRIPYTPIKERKSHSKKVRVSSHSDLHSLILKLKILLKDIERLLENLKQKFTQTAQLTVRHIENSIKDYLQEVMKRSGLQESRSVSEFKQVDAHFALAKQDKEVRKSNELYSEDHKSISNQSQFSRNETSEIKNQRTQEVRPERETQSKSNIFSNTLQIRDKLRKDATGLVVRHQKMYAEDSSGRLMVGEKREGSSQKRDNMAKSIEKLQRQLKSLKNILNE